MKSIQKNNKGFTLLEIIIVIIIIGVLASLALPRFLRTVEYSRGAEALSHLSSIRQAMQRCYLVSNSYAPCNVFTALDIEDPGTNPATHFTYGIVSAAGTFTITATRNGFDNGDGISTINIDQVGTKAGTGVFSAVR